MVTAVEIYPMDGEAVTLERAKRHLNIEPDFVLFDETVTEQRDAATVEAETYCGPLFQQYVVNLDGFDAVELCCAATAVVVSVKYLSGETDYTTLDAANYYLTRVNNNKVRLAFKGALPELEFPGDAAVVATINSSCPAPVAAGILLRIGDLFARREDRNAESSGTAVMNLWRPYRKSY
jgi:hypothetical protein